MTPRVLVLVGLPGTGKTALAQAIATHRMARGRPVFVADFANAMEVEGFLRSGGSRSWKVIAPPAILLRLPGAEVVEGLAYPTPPRDG